MINSNHHHRRSIRLPEHDYSQLGANFVTICTWQRACVFGDVADGEMRMNEYGKIVKKCWYELPTYYENIEMDEMVVMPNHVHGIINIVGAPLAGALLIAGGKRATARVAPTNGGVADFDRAIVSTNNANNGIRHATPVLGDVVGAFKSLSVKYCLDYIKRERPGMILGKLWQRNYYERVIRDENELHRIREYIRFNPAKWGEDRNNLDVMNKTNHRRGTPCGCPMDYGCPGIENHEGDRKEQGDRIPIRGQAGRPYGMENNP